MDPAADSSSSRVVVSVPCDECGTDQEPQESCLRCHGSGIVLLRVKPEHAAWPPAELRAAYSPPGRDRRS